MRHETRERGEETEIVLFVLIPECKACRDRIEETLMEMRVWERIDIGYPGEQGSTVALVYRKGKFPSVDYWQAALEAKRRLDLCSYRVL